MEGNMGKKEIYTQKVIFVTKCMLAAYILTAGLLLLLAFMLYRFRLSEKVVSICIIGIYIVVTFAIGLLAGKREGKRKFLWGLAMGVAYYVILVIVSLVVNRGLQDVAGNMVTVFILCAGSGMLGGMIS
ncbi:MAG: TIGR04086 family membrane protein [Lachnospiraceae bacterium]|nr:TIGR04086 family membrane protein [Lachnospiraceae bacterium]